jgi:DNA-directed RNA polymerase beta subunit
VSLNKKKAAKFFFSWILMSSEDETMFDARNALFDVGRDTFFLRDQTSFLMSGFHSLLTTSVPLIVKNQTTSCSVVIKGLKYSFSLSNVKVHNSGIHLSECFQHQLSLRLPIVADFQLDVTPLIGSVQEDGKPAPPTPTVLSHVRSVVMQHPICTGKSPLATSGLEDPEIQDQNFHSGVFICNGKMRTIPCTKSMYNNTILLMERKKLFRLQVRSGHEGNRSIEEGNPFRSTSSIDFEISKIVKRNSFEGEIKCKLPFSKQQVHIGVLAQAFGCAPTRFVELVKSLAGVHYDAATFFPYETDITYRMQDVTNQAEAQARLGNKNGSSTGVNLLKTEIFPHLNVMFAKGNQEGLYFTKLLYLARCTSMLILFAAGKIKETSRDLWQFANIIMPAFQIGTLVRAQFMNHMTMFSKLLRRALTLILKKAPDKQVHIDLVKLFAEPRLSWRIMRAMSTGAFSKKKQGVSIPLNDHNHDAIMSQLHRISSSMRTTDSTHVEPRKVQNDSFGYVCAASTPDGELAGLVSDLASTATITVDLDDPKAHCDLVELCLKPYLMDIVKTLQNSPLTEEQLEDRKRCVEHANNKKRKLQQETIKKLQKKRKGRLLITEEEVVVPSSVHEPDSLSVELVNNVDFSKVEKEWYVFTNNCGVPTHFVRPEHVNDVVSAFRLARRRGEICRQAFITVGDHPREIRVFCEGGQITRPLIVIDNLHKIRKPMTFQDCIENGIIEYVNPAEEQTLCKVVVCMEDLKLAVDNKKSAGLTHMEFTQASFVGLMASCVTYLTSIQGPRLTYSKHQKNQIIGAGTKRYRGSVLSTELWYNHNNLVFTEIASQVPDAKDGGGHPCIVMLLTTPSNQEDAFMVKEEAVQRGAFTACTTRYYTSDIKAPTHATSERFEKPVNVLSRKNLVFSAVGENGLARKNTIVPGGEVIIAKTRLVRKTTNAAAAAAAANIDNNNQNTAKHNRLVIVKRDISQTTHKDEGGVVDDTRVEATITGKRVRTSVVTTRHMRCGDKGSTDQSQKGVCAQVCKEQFMPFCEVTGMIPDLVASPLGIISRMTMASPLEATIGKAVAASGDLNFGMDRHQYSRSCKRKLEQAGDILVSQGYRRNGTHTMRCGRTGKRLKGEVFVGVVFYKQLNHLAEKKLQYRSCGRRCPVTRHAKQGKRNDGGLRFGEQESAAVTAQGAAAVLQARLRDSSDPFHVFICNKCQNLAVGNKDVNFAWCQQCVQRASVEHVKVPFTFHLGSGELLAVGLKTMHTTERDVATTS